MGRFFCFCERRTHHGGRKFKLSFRLFQEKEIGTIVYGQKNRIGVLKQAMFSRTEGLYLFFIENGYKLVIPEQVFFQHTLLRHENDCFFFEFSSQPVLSGVLAYCLFETYGFPLEFAVDEMERRGMPVDEAGFHIMMELARRREKNTFKGKGAFG